jgi:hypothetical protein
MFTALFLTAPALLFLIQVVIFMPAIFFLAGILYVIPKAFAPGHTAESLAFIAFLGIHVLVNGGVFYGISVLAAKAITLTDRPQLRNAAVTTACAGLAGLTLLPVYGAGGHGPMHWLTLTQALADVNKSYGAGTVWIVYGTTLLVFCLILLVRHLRRKPIGQTAS